MLTPFTCAKAIGNLWSIHLEVIISISSLGIDLYLASHAIVE